MASKRYEIEKISDIFLIPEDRFSDFLVDFKSFYKMSRPLVELFDEITKTSGLEATPSLPTKMVWVDDGKHDAKVFIKTVKKSE